MILLFYQKYGKYCILFNKRTAQVEFNKGEICFPGGSKDPEDPDLVTTALRETYEEMGILPEDVTILGGLNDVTTRSGFIIHPFVGTIPYPYKFKPAPTEVAAVLEIPITTLCDSTNIMEKALVQPGGPPVRGRSYVYESHLIYGATARILEQFLEYWGGPNGPIQRP